MAEPKPTRPRRSATSKWRRDVALSRRQTPLRKGKQLQYLRFNSNFIPHESLRLLLTYLSISGIFSNNNSVSIALSNGGFFKDDRNFYAFFDPLPLSERKMTSLLLNTMMSLLLIVTAFG